MSREIMVSVVCLTYNHEKYIRQTLEGFVSQKTTFKYEVIIHDDASTDKTAKIIKEYEQQYPDIIKPIYQSKNQYSQRNPIYKQFTVPLVTGKYVALCEGDDYWTDYDKLQKQFEIMERNPDCSICTHKIKEINEDGSETDNYRPSIAITEGKIDLESFLKIQRQYPFQTASYFMKTSLWCTLMQNPPAFKQVAPVGDEPMLLFMLTHGDMYYLPECMSVYRVCSMGSWSYKNKTDPKRKADITKRLYDMMCLFDEYTDHKYDCNLAIYRGRMLLYSKRFIELLKKENIPYVKQLSVPKRAFIYLCVCFPFLSRFMK